MNEFEFELCLNHPVCSFLLVTAALVIVCPILLGHAMPALCNAQYLTQVKIINDIFFEFEFSLDVNYLK